MQNIGSSQNIQDFIVKGLYVCVLFFCGGNRALEYAYVSYVGKVEHSCPLFIFWKYTTGTHVHMDTRGKARDERKHREEEKGERGER